MIVYRLSQSHLNWIWTTIAATHSIKSLATRIAVSEPTLHRQFVATTGVLPYEWILRERIEIAKGMFEDRTLNLIEIAEKIGFASEAILRKHFRNQTGISPGQYRKQFCVTD